MQLPMEGEHARHPVIDVGQDGNIDRVRRMIDLAFAEVEDALFPYTKKQVETDFSLNDNLIEKEEYRLDLSVPKEFSATTIKYLEHLIHEYIVSFVLSDWLAMTFPAARDKWELRKLEMLTTIRENLGGRMKKRRRRPSVF